MLWGLIVITAEVLLVFIPFFYGTSELEFIELFRLRIDASC